jgi:aspartokinase
MKILKFGGSSLATPANVRTVGRIVLDARRREPTRSRGPPSAASARS